MISGTGEDDMPDMGLIAEAIMDPEGKGASSFFTEMSMKNILGDDLGEIMAASQDERPDKMQEYVLGQMGKFQAFDFIQRFLSSFDSIGNLKLSDYRNGLLDFIVSRKMLSLFGISSRLCIYFRNRRLCYSASAFQPKRTDWCR